MANSNTQMPIPVTVPLMVLAFCGLPGSGKSSASAIIAATLKWPVITTERIRVALYPELANNPDDTDFSSGEQVATYTRLGDQAAAILHRGENAIVDGVFRSTSQRGRLEDVASEFEATVLWVLLTCDDDVAQERLKQRKILGGAAEAGPVGPESYRGIATEFVPFETPPFTIDTSHRTPYEVAKLILRIVEQRGVPSPGYDSFTT